MVVRVPPQGDGWDALPQCAFDRDVESPVMVLRVAWFNGQVEVGALNDYMQEWQLALEDEFFVV
jgi:hypothetical protein